MTEEIAEEITFIQSLSFNARVMIGIISTILILSFFGFLTPELEIFGDTLNWGWFALFLGVAYVVFSVRFFDPVKADKIAVRTLLGAPKDTIGSGPPFLPLLIMDTIVLNRLVVQREFPAEPSKTYKGEMKTRELLPEGMVPASRLVFGNSIESDDEARKIFDKDYEVLDIHKVTKKMRGGKEWHEFTYDQLDTLEEDLIKKYEDDGLSPPTVKFRHDISEDALSQRLTAELKLVTRWRILQAIAIDFVENIGSEEEANRQIEDEMASISARLLPNMSVGQALTNTAWFNAHLYFAIIKRTIGWGVKVEGSFIKPIELSHGVNKAISKKVEAEFIGKADKKLLVLRGEGAAQAARDLEQETLAGRGEGMRAYAKAIGVDGASVQAAEVARAVADGGNTIVVGTEGIGQLVGMAAAAVMPKKQPQQITSDNNKSESNDSDESEDSPEMEDSEK